MKIQDKLYKEIEIDNPIIEKLIHTKPFQRLKEINQYGGVNLVFPDRYQVSRYQHSLGVYHVLKTLGASLETQIVGLLHDIGHTALSHMYDMALETKTENNHEQIMHNLEGWDEVEEILTSTTLKDLSPDKYNLIKKSLPDIGTDRFDYALRDYAFSTNSYSESPLELLKNLARDKVGLYFESTDCAKEFAKNGNQAMWNVIYEPTVAIIYISLIEMIHIGLKGGWLTLEDFMKTDKHVIEKMLRNKSLIPEKYVRVFSEKYTVEEVNKEDSDFEFIKLKSRYFDPRVRSGNKISRISKLDFNTKKSLEQYIQLFERAKSGIYYKVTFT